MKQKNNNQKENNNDNKSLSRGEHFACGCVFARGCSCFNCFYFVLNVFGGLYRLLRKGLRVVKKTNVRRKATFIILKTTNVRRKTTFIILKTTNPILETNLTSEKSDKFYTQKINKATNLILRKSIKRQLHNHVAFDSKMIYHRGI